MVSSLMQGKKGLIFGVANNHSIAWGIGELLARSGAKTAFTYQGEALERRVRPLASSVGADMVLPCDVTDPTSLDALFDAVKKTWGTLDFVVHAVAFSDRNELKGRYCDTTLDNFLKTMTVSCYSFTDICKRAEKIANDGASFITLSYYGAQKAFPNYNVMGVAKAALEASVRYLACDFGARAIRVNAISAGPIKTLAASGISDLRQMLKMNEMQSPLKRNMTITDVGKTALYLLSDLSSGVTGQTIFADGGYSITGMTSPTTATASEQGE